MVMETWCTTAEVDALVAGSPEQSMLQEYAEHATSLLYTMSGRKFIGEQTVASEFEINRRGYVPLTMWQPVRDVTTATIDGEAIEYALSPAGAYVTFDLTHRNKTVTLTIEYGLDPPVAGKRAAAALAAEMLRGDPRYATSGTGGGDPGDTRPASRLLSISRQGVMYTFADPATLAEKDLTGVYEVDLFLRAANPHGLRHQPKVVKAS